MRGIKREENDFLPRTCSPVQDETEARIVHRTLTELVEQQDPNLLGANLGQVRHNGPVFAFLFPRYCQTPHLHHNINNSVPLVAGIAYRPAGYDNGDRFSTIKY